MIKVEEVKFAKEEKERLTNTLEEVNKNRVEALNKIEEAIRNITNKYLIEGSQILDRDIYIDVYDENIFEFRFRVGFIDPEKSNCSIFGADFSIEYKDEMLYIGAGTIGSYCKLDKYQIKRVMAIAEIWKNIEEIENAIKNIDLNSYKEILHNYYEIKDNIRICNNIIKEAEDEEVLNSMSVDDQYMYGETSYDLKGEWIRNKADCIVNIKNITNDNVIYTQSPNSKCSRVSKMAFINYIKSKKLIKLNH